MITIIINRFLSVLGFSLACRVARRDVVVEQLVLGTLLNDKLDFEFDGYLMSYLLALAVKRTSLNKQGRYP